ncbi:MAG TPA: hypothetical protein PKV88_06880 [Bacteroidales bacterium]|jgi:hypothetical protein|nr:hypothetical protein [Bacteroidales bacterium]HPE43789.1 hypothetical protein [Bacteroidales bacterium]
MRKLFLLIFLFSLIGMISQAQKRVSDTTVSTVLFQATYAYQIPGGDLTEFFGNNSTIGGGVSYKTDKNWLFGAFGHFIFGDQVYNRAEIFKGISTAEGEVIDGNGLYTSLALFERGFHMQFKAGKLFNVLGPNPNSGIYVQAGLGYLTHRIRIETQFGTAPQLMDDYALGYDRMRGGFAFSGEFGYLLMSNSRLLNLSIALEFTQVSAKSLRDYDFALMRKDDKSYSDQYYGIRISWMIPTYKRAPQDYYYY